MKADIQQQSTTPSSTMGKSTDNNELPEQPVPASEKLQLLIQRKTALEKALQEKSILLQTIQKEESKILGFYINNNELASEILNKKFQDDNFNKPIDNMNKALSKSSSNISELTQISNSNVNHSKIHRSRRKVIGASFKLPEHMLNSDNDIQATGETSGPLTSNCREWTNTLQELLLSKHMQEQICDASLRLANDSSLHKSLRRSHKHGYEQSRKKLDSLTQQINTLTLKIQTSGNDVIGKGAKSAAHSPQYAKSSLIKSSISTPEINQLTVLTSNQPPNQIISRQKKNHSPSHSRLVERNQSVKSLNTQVLQNNQCSPIRNCVSRAETIHITPTQKDYYYDSGQPPLIVRNSPIYKSQNSNIQQIVSPVMNQGGLGGYWLTSENNERLWCRTDYRVASLDRKGNYVSNNIPNVSNQHHSTIHNQQRQFQPHQQSVSNQHLQQQQQINRQQQGYSHEQHNTDQYDQQNIYKNTNLTSGTSRESNSGSPQLAAIFHSQPSYDSQSLHTPHSYDRYEELISSHPMADTLSVRSVYSHSNFQTDNLSLISSTGSVENNPKNEPMPEKNKQWIETSLDGPAHSYSHHIKQQMPKRHRTYSATLQHMSNPVLHVDERDMMPTINIDESNQYAEIMECPPKTEQMETQYVSNAKFYPPKQQLNRSHSANLVSTMGVNHSNTLQYVVQPEQQPVHLPVQNAISLPVKNSQTSPRYVKLNSHLPDAQNHQHIKQSPQQIKQLNVEHEISCESPKNMEVVQQAKFLPYKEVSKPFEMSDFYKYSTKFRNSRPPVSENNEISAIPPPLPPPNTKKNVQNFN